jgi:hypothetical protein
MGKKDHVTIRQMVKVDSRIRPPRPCHTRTEAYVVTCEEEIGLRSITGLADPPLRIFRNDGIHIYHHPHALPLSGIGHRQQSFFLQEGRPTQLTV